MDDRIKKLHFSRPKIIRQAVKCLLSKFPAAPYWSMVLDIHGK